MTRAEGRQTPPFEAWRAQSGVRLARDSYRTMEQLYHDIFVLDEVRIDTRDGEKIRYGKLVSLDVFYQSGNGKTYKLREDRYSLKPGRRIGEVIEGNDMTALSPSPARPAPSSLSERVKISGEDHDDAAVRALHEELFDTAVKDSGKEFPRLEQTIRDNLILKESRELKRGPFAPGNSYRDLTSVYDEKIYGITFTPDMNVPITQDDQGIPQRLYEYLPDEGYVNLFTWHEITGDK